MIGTKIDLQKIKPLPLAKRNSLSTVEEVLVPLDAEPAAISDHAGTSRYSRAMTSR